MIRLLDISYSVDLYQELARVGVDPAAWEIFRAKSAVRALKISGLSVAGANILKQTALVAGGDCAVHRNTISGKVRQTDAILFATERQIAEICQRLSHQPECARRLVPFLEELRANSFCPNPILKVGSCALDLARRVQVMGILNVTPDSFYDGGRYLAPEQAVEQGIRLSEEGADIIDIGAESTRPGSNPVPANEQLRRLLPVLKQLTRQIKVPISVDTTSARVAKAALDAGAGMVNDISGLNFDPQMAKVVARAGVPVIVMHIKGKPRTMQKNPVYQDLMAEIVNGLARSIKRGEDAGIASDKFLVDPGIGFGKTVAHNLEILRRLRELQTLGKPIVVGPSRKSFIGAVLNLPVEERLEGTIAAGVVAALNGARIVRVHDVRALRRALALVDAIYPPLAGKGAHRAK
ncbi:MAG: dihydropteroate synthase [candidate division WOR-3 bacterium]|jgi:dihydropteroate synthase|nr:dihydropteroate synthase [candidate division WOR-3 bacterium]MDH7519227.1 dihydropteroate synthase [bacterium]